MFYLAPVIIPESARAAHNIHYLNTTSGFPATIATSSS